MEFLNLGEHRTCFFIYQQSLDVDINRRNRDIASSKFLISNSKEMSATKCLDAPLTIDRQSDVKGVVSFENYSTNRRGYRT
jgi:hypothetical protein